MKKKLFIVTTFILSAILFLTFQVENTKAEEEEEGKCEIYTNYYLFQDTSSASEITRYGYSSSANPKTYGTFKGFALGIPKDGEYVGSGQVSITKSPGMSHSTSSWTTAYFYQMMEKTLPSNGRAVASNGTESTVYTDENAKESFATTRNWAGPNGNSDAQGVVPSDYSEYILEVPDGFGHTNFTDENYAIQDYFTMSVSRYWTPDEISSLTRVQSPAVYYLQYKMCEKNKVTIHYYIEGTVEKLREDFIDKNVEEGLYTKECPTPLDKDNKYYDRTTPSVSVEMEKDSEEELFCYYKEQTYTLTIDYGEDENCTKLVKDSETKNELKAGENVTMPAPTRIGNESFTGIGTYSSQIKDKPSLNGNNVSLVMPAKNVKVCLVYQPQTGSSKVIFAGITGMAALGFMVWFLTKRKNAENV